MFYDFAVDLWSCFVYLCLLSFCISLSFTVYCICVVVSLFVFTLSFVVCVYLCVLCLFAVMVGVFVVSLVMI